MRDRILIVGLVVALCSVSFIGGYQLHEPRVVTETETVTEVEKVEVPKVITKTETKVEKVKVEDTQVVRDEVFVGDNADRIEDASVYMMLCSPDPDSYNTGGMVVEPGQMGATNEYDSKTNSFAYVIHESKFSGIGNIQVEMSEEKFDYLVQEHCGVPAEENEMKEDVEFVDSDDDNESRKAGDQR